MGRYAKLGTLAMRCAAIALFVTAALFLFFGVSGTAMTGSMMAGRMPMMAGGGAGAGPAIFAAWWPALFSAALGALLFGLSRALGSVLGAGLDD